MAGFSLCTGDGVNSRVIKSWISFSVRTPRESEETEILTPLQRTSFLERLDMATRVIRAAANSSPIEARRMFLVNGFIIIVSLKILYY